LFLECSGCGTVLHSHSFDVSTHLFNFFIANFIAESDQTESKQKDDLVGNECIETHVQKLRTPRMH